MKTIVTKLKHYLIEYYPPVVFLAVILIVWQISCYAMHVSMVILPTPTRIAHSLVSDWSLIWSNLIVTMLEILIGFLVSLVVGMVLGILIVYSKALERLLYPLVIVSQVIPIFAVAPLMIIWFGFGLTPKIIIAAMVTFFPICVNQVEGLRSVDPGIINLMRSYNATEFQIFRIVRFPSSLPYLFAGIQVGITFSVMGAIIGEWVGSEKGVGAFMITANSMSRTDRVFAGIFVLAVLGIALFLLAKIIGKFLMPWQKSTRS